MRTYDFIAIGAGPFNLGLACLTAPLDELDGVVLEQREQFDWHPGMMLEGSTIQVPFLADLVSMADPTSRYSFLNYLKQNGRLYPFYIRENFYPLRKEYNAYCRWAARQLPNVRFSSRVERVEHDAAGGDYLVYVRGAGGVEVLRGRRIVLGVGDGPYIPPAARDLPGPVVHSSEYLPNRGRLRELGSITVVGSGQSAAEIYLDLLRESDEHGYHLRWVTRSPRFFPMEYTKLTLELTSPDYIDHFHSLPAERRDELLREQRSLYKGISDDLVNTIFDTLYEKSLDGPVNTTLMPCTAMTGVARQEEGQHYRLDLLNTEQQRSFSVATDGVILATGYTKDIPTFLDPVRSRIRLDEHGRYSVARGYTVDDNDSEIFVQNAEEHTHGFTAPDLGMGAYRNSVIIAAMVGREVYPVERRIAFQEFGSQVAGDRFELRSPFGVFSIEPLRHTEHLPRLHAWLTHPRALYWGMQHADEQAVAKEYARIEANQSHHAWLGRLDGEPLFLAETYDPAHSELAGHYAVQPGDVGMHVLVAPPETHRHGLTSAVMRTVMSFIFSDENCDRVVVEPDVSNEAIARKNAEAGFVVDRAIELSDKKASLSFCTRAAFAVSPLESQS